MSVDVFFEDGVEKYFERVSEIDEVLIMRCEEDCFFRLFFREMEAEDVVNEEVRLL